MELLGGIAGIVAYLAFLPPVGFLLIQGEVVVPLFGSLYEAGPGLSVANAFGAVLFFFVSCLLVVITFIDLKTQEIPNSLNLCLLACGVLSLLILPQITLLSHLIGLVCVSVPMLLISLAAPGAFGMGDVKLMGACGLLLGWEQVLAATLIAIIIGGAQGVFFLATRRKKRKDHFAFGPALCIGIVAALYAGRLLVASSIMCFF